MSHACSSGRASNVPLASENDKPNYCQRCSHYDGNDRISSLSRHVAMCRELSQRSRRVRSTRGRTSTVIVCRSCTERLRATNHRPDSRWWRAEISNQDKADTSVWRTKKLHRIRRTKSPCTCALRRSPSEVVEFNNGVDHVSLDEQNANRGRHCSRL